jgi:hypothetical protein
VRAGVIGRGAGRRSLLAACQQEVPVFVVFSLVGDGEPGRVQPVADLRPGRIVVVAAVFDHLAGHLARIGGGELLFSAGVRGSCVRFSLFATTIVASTSSTTSSALRSVSATMQVGSPSGDWDHTYRRTRARADVLAALPVGTPTAEALPALALAVLNLPVHWFGVVSAASRQRDDLAGPVSLVRRGGRGRAGR